jgi:hypothetical protein
MRSMEILSLECINSRANLRSILHEVGMRITADKISASRKKRFFKFVLLKLLIKKSG